MPHWALPCQLEHTVQSVLRMLLNFGWNTIHRLCCYVEIHTKAERLIKSRSFSFRNVTKTTITLLNTFSSNNIVLNMIKQSTCRQRKAMLSLAITAHWSFYNNRWLRNGYRRRKNCPSLAHEIDFWVWYCVHRDPERKTARIVLLLTSFAAINELYS